MSAAFWLRMVSVICALVTLWALSYSFYTPAFWAVVFIAVNAGFYTALILRELITGRA